MEIAEAMVNSGIVKYVKKIVLEVYAVCYSMVFEIYLIRWMDTQGTEATISEKSIETLQMVVVILTNRGDDLSQSKLFDAYNQYILPIWTEHDDMSSWKASILTNLPPSKLAMRMESIISKPSSNILSIWLPDEIPAVAANLLYIIDRSKHSFPLEVFDGLGWLPQV